MNTCRTCLNTPAEKDISELEIGLNEDNINCLSIMLFCLDIKIADESKITTNLCNECYTKIITFYKFKTLALKSDAYLNSLYPVPLIIDIEHDYESEIKQENIFDSDDYAPNSVEDCNAKMKIDEASLVEDNNVEIKYELDFDNEGTLGNVMLNEEHQSEVQQIKYEYIEEEIKGNAQLLKKRGPKRKYSSCKKENLKQKRCPRKKIRNDKPEHQISEECGETVPDLKEHSVQHLSEEEQKMLRCKACPKLFLSVGGLNKHYRIIHLGLKPKSAILNKAQIDRKETKKVKACDDENNEEKRQVCEECGMSVVNLKEHSRRHQPRDSRQMLQCKACPKLFLSRGGRRRHYKHIHLGKKTKCDICDKEVMHLSTHKLQVHNKHAAPFGCVSCERRFVSRGALDRHLVTHTKLFPFECDICHGKYQTKEYIAKHIRQVHLKEKNYRCDICTKCFFEKSLLLNHLRMHSAERLFKCADCQKSYATKRLLRVHRTIHTADGNNYSCKVCNKSFKLMRYLNTHMRNHTHKKAYPCHFCSARFGRHNSRRRHELSHHNITS